MTTQKLVSQIKRLSQWIYLLKNIHQIRNKNFSTIIEIFIHCGVVICHKLRKTPHQSQVKSVKGNFWQDLSPVTVTGICRRNSGSLLYFMYYKDSVLVHKLKCLVKFLENWERYKDVKTNATHSLEFTDQKLFRTST